MRKSRKIHRKSNKTQKCVYTDEVKRLSREIKQLKKKHNTRKNKSN
jgi:hypothetical protein